MNSETFEDAFNLLCGELLGEGAYRKVYECRLREDLVVKVETEPIGEPLPTRWKCVFGATMNTIKRWQIG